MSPLADKRLYVVPLQFDISSRDDFHERDLDACVIMLLGETTFHQVHGGIATNVMESAAPFGAEYRRIRGTRYQRPTGWPLFVGRLNMHALANMRRSLRLLEREVQETSGSPQ